MSKNKIYKPRPISGFPEWLPDIRMIEQQWLDHIRRIFESYGFCNIETPSVEELDVLHAKGEDVDKEIYVLERLHKEDGDKDARLALHFDQTVPLARYTAQHFNELVFPFKRYQMQRVWRGERPQAGRFREFTQCDIDVINIDHLPLHFDAEMPAIIWEVLSSLPGMENENIQIRISNRKILMGLIQSLGFEKEKGAKFLKAIDKAQKVSSDQLMQEVLGALGFYNKQGQLIDQDGNKINYAQELSSGNSDRVDFIRDFEELVKFITDKKYNSFQELKNSIYQNPLFDASHPITKDGLDNLKFVMDSLKHLPEGAVVADLSIVRGLDYYTGTVYETVFTDDPGYGSICSGGRYDDLAGSYISKHLPGVGISIGFSRLFSRLHDQGKLPQGRLSPADVLVMIPAEEHRALAMETAAKLRANGLNVETAHGGKFKKQLAYAEKKGIPFVWIPDLSEVKNMTTGEQTKADPSTWRPS